MSALTPAPAAALPRRVIPYIEGVLLISFLLLPLAVDDFWVLFFTRVFILGLLALSFDLVWGYAGILSFGQALFFGVAGYSCALLATKAGITSILLLLPVAALVGLAVSVALAFLVILGKRVPTSVFVALGTLTGSYVVERLARGWSYVGGQNGIPSLPRLTMFGHEIAEGPVYYYFALAILALIYLGLRWLTRSQFGLVLAGIREQETRIAFFGYHVQNYKGVVFAIAGLIAGLSGGLYAFHEGYVGPGQLGPVLSTQVVLYVLFGGVGTLIGGIIGVAMIDLFSYFLSQQWETGWPIVLGLLLLIVVMFKPTGLIGFLVTARERVGSFGRRAPKPKGREKPSTAAAEVT
ncbi:MAG: branched-chain amino acid ABC transporter permease [Betaproteobacteria bacterium]|nr:branched-chain amino acid ABC transporter permease [Betaproteobacteria bacterium]